MMEEGEGEDLDIDDIIAQYGAFDDTTMGGDEEEVAVEDDLSDALGDAIRDAQQECESEKEKVKFERILEDHRKLLYPTAEDGQKKLGTTLELLQWKAKNGIPDGLKEASPRAMEQRRSLSSVLTLFLTLPRIATRGETQR